LPIFTVLRGARSTRMKSSATFTAGSRMPRYSGNYPYPDPAFGVAHAPIESAAAAIFTQPAKENPWRDSARPISALAPRITWPS
jgi:hypothetical protein